MGTSPVMTFWEVWDSFCSCNSIRGSYFAAAQFVPVPSDKISEYKSLESPDLLLILGLEAVDLPLLQLGHVQHFRVFCLFNKSFQNVD